MDRSSTLAWRRQGKIMVPITAANEPNHLTSQRSHPHESFKRNRGSKRSFRLLPRTSNLMRRHGESGPMAFGVRFGLVLARIASPRAIQT